MEAANGASKARRGMAAALSLEFLLLCAASRFGDFAVAGNSLKFVGLMFVAGAVFVATLGYMRVRRIEPTPVAFWIAAVALRVAMLGMVPSDDFWRYVWEGRLQHLGWNPYVLGPSALELVPFRDALWHRINYPESAAIYPPAAELVFAAIARFSTSVIAFKCTFICADLLTALVLVRLCRSSRAAAWYAWNPAVVGAFAGAAHFDSLMLLPMTAALFALERATADPDRPAHWNWALLSAALLGLAIAFKLIPVFLLPAWICALGWRSGVLALTLAVPAALSSIYGGMQTVLGPLLAFADVTRFNDLTWWIVEAITIPNPFQRNWPFTVALAVGVLIATIRFRADWRRCGFWSLGLALVLSPVFHPWYATWILPLACWRRVHAWSVLSLSVLAAFVLWETTQWWTAWQPNLLTRALVILPPLIAWRCEAALRKPRTPAA